jgi:hypothetical protein
LTTKEISIFSNSSHFECRVGLTDTILKGDYPRTIPAQFALIWFSDFRGKDLNVEKFLDVLPVPYKKTVSFVNLKHSTMATYPCVICKIHVRLRQQALECDGCFQWQHRLCNSDNFNFIFKL